MKLLSESIDSSFMKTELIEEDFGEQKIKSWYIHGPFIMTEERNKNGRIYKKNAMEREVKLFTEEKIKKNHAAGELNHPESPIVNLDRISHYIKELRCDGNNYYGKAKLANTPMGLIAQTLIKDGYQLGVSTRGLGTVAEDGEVSEDFKLLAIDLVSDPSAHNAFVQSIYENKNYLINTKGEIFEEPIKKLETHMKSLPKKDVDKYLFEAINNFIRGLK